LEGIFEGERGGIGGEFEPKFIDFYDILLYNNKIESLGSGGVFYEYGGSKTVKTGL
jgi:hypothetical protein